MFKKETTPEVFLNKRIVLKSSGASEIIVEGVITGTFGKSGKQKVDLQRVLSMEEMEKAINAEVELRYKVFSKELQKLNKKHN